MLIFGIPIIEFILMLVFALGFLVLAFAATGGQYFGEMIGFTVTGTILAFLAIYLISIGFYFSGHPSEFQQFLNDTNKALFP